MDAHPPHHRRTRRIGVAIAGFACGMAVAAMVSALPIPAFHVARSAVSGQF